MEAAGRRAALGLAMTVLAGRATAQTQFAFDQAHGRLTFSARVMGLIGATSAFSRFRCRMTLDPARPTAARIAIEAEAGSIENDRESVVAMLRGPEWFDAARHPVVRFEGAATGAGDAARFLVAGIITLRGVTRPAAFDATLGAPRQGAALFSATGAISRGEFGMVADRFTIGDRVVLALEVRLPIGG
ncbi:MAG: YceI family protein [Pseudomonadota bacterium]